MKKICILTLCLATSLLTALTAKADGYDLYIVALDGTTCTSLDYVNLRSLSFTQVREDNGSGTKVYVNRMFANYKDGSQKLFNLADYSAIRFDDYSVGIEDIRVSDRFQATLQFDGTRVTPLHSGKMTVYSLDGRRVAAYDVRSGAAVDVQNLTSGTYLINLGGKTTKILVK